MKGKKATTPMLTTIFLLVFALALGYLLVDINTYVPTKDLVCEDMYDVNIAVVPDGPWICQEKNIDKQNNSIRFIVVNNADTKNVDGLLLTFIGTSSKPVYTYRDFDILIKPGGNSARRYNFPKNIGELQQVKISVYRKVGEYTKLCSKPSIIINSIPECEERGY